MIRVCLHLESGFLSQSVESFEAAAQLLTHIRRSVENGQRLNIVSIAVFVRDTGTEELCHFYVPANCPIEQVKTNNFHT